MKILLDIKNKRILKIISAIILPILIISASVITYNIKKNNDIVTNVNEELNYNNYHLFMLDKYQNLTPTNYKIKKDSNLEEVGKILIEGLKGSEELENKGYFPLIFEATNVNSLTINDDTILVDFKCLEYDESKEKRMLESLTFTLLDNLNLSKLVLSLNGDLLTLKSNHSIDYPLTKEIGINKHLASPSPLKSPLTIYFQNKISKAFTPLTVYASLDLEMIEAINKAIKTPLTHTNYLENYELSKRIEITSFEYDGNELNVSLSESALYDESTIDVNVYHYLMMNLKINDVDFEKVSFLILDNAYNVNGYDSYSYSYENLIINK